MERKLLLGAPFLTAALLCGEHAALAQQENQAAPAMLDPVAEVLRWLPERTDTILVAQSFELPVLPGVGGGLRMDGDLSDAVALVLRAFATHPPSDRDEPDRNEILRFLAGRKVAWAVHGAAEHEGVTAFGGFRYQGCHVLRFEQDLGDAHQKLEASLQADATTVKTIAGQKAYVLDWEFLKEPYIKTAEWETLLVVQPEPRMLIFATHKGYLTSLLERRRRNPPERVALPPNLLVWRHVDPTAPAWGVRHFRSRRGGQGDKRASMGFALTLQPDGHDVLRIAYLPASGGPPAELARERWLRSELTKDLGELGLKAQAGEGQVEVVTLPLAESKDYHSRLIQLSFALSHLMADDLVLRHE